MVYDIAPSQNVLAIVQGGEAALLQWDLIPSWSKEAKGSINARSETIEVKPSYHTETPEVIVSERSRDLDVSLFSALG